MSVVDQSLLMLLFIQDTKNLSCTSSNQRKLWNHNWEIECSLIKMNLEVSIILYTHTTTELKVSVSIF